MPLGMVGRGSAIRAVLSETKSHVKRCTLCLYLPIHTHSFIHREMKRELNQNKCVKNNIHFCISVNMAASSSVLSTIY